MTDRFVHPEATADEILIGNIYACDFARVGWKTKRLGKVALDHSGKKLKGGNMRPVFAARSEVLLAFVDIPDIGPIDHRW